jgi:hypothetical protein
MCDGESMFVESCPGGTVWDDLNKACVWPDMQGVVGTSMADQSQLQQQGLSLFIYISKFHWLIIFRLWSTIIIWSTTPNVESTNIWFSSSTSTTTST